jgi:mono/diheme cytochrome c family protein
MNRPRLRAWLVVTATALLLLVTLAFGVYVYLTGDEPDLPISAESGREYFRHRSFGSPFETGIPFALVLASLERFPDELGRDRDAFCAKFGTLIDPGSPSSLPVGFAVRSDQLSGTEFLMTNCSLCHTAELNGKLIDGLGNRNLRLNALNQAVMRVAARPEFNAATMVPASAAAAKRRGIPWGWRAAWATEAAIGVLKKLYPANSAGPMGGLKSVDAGPGRNTPVEFGKEASGVPVAPPYGLTKLPVVWTYGRRESFSCDGSLKGDKAFALAAVEFNKKMPVPAILARAARWESVYAYLKSLVPPAYPAPIDEPLAERGRAVFQENCSYCHGTYGPGRPVHYRERIVPLDVVGTDPDRLHAVSPELVAARARGAFARKVQLEISKGYVPPPLDGIWCRGPYLHNGSVPTIVDLLRAPEDRPESFYNGGDTGYDLARLGLPYDEETRPDGRRIGRRGSDRQFLFDTRGKGNSNAGHEFGVDLDDDDKRSLLEYLKQL